MTFEKTYELIRDYVKSEENEIELKDDSYMTLVGLLWEMPGHEELCLYYIDSEGQIDYGLIVGRELETGVMTARQQLWTGHQCPILPTTLVEKFDYIFETHFVRRVRLHEAS